MNIFINGDGVAGCICKTLDGAWALGYYVLPAKRATGAARYKQFTGPTRRAILAKAWALGLEKVYTGAGSNRTVRPATFFGRPR